MVCQDTLELLSRNGVMNVSRAIQPHTVQEIWWISSGKLSVQDRVRPLLSMVEILEAGYAFEDT